jgi:hypothetical protein
MATIIDPGETVPRGQGVLARSVPVTTTLYDVLATLQDVIGPGHDHLVVATVVFMLSTRALTVPQALALQAVPQQ